MSTLKISLIGPYEVRLADNPAITFTTHKVQALLAYLAAEPTNPHSRETLAALLWPEQSSRKARLSLRQASFQLRQAIAPEYILITRQTIQFNPASDYKLDLTTFTELISAWQAHASQVPCTCSNCIRNLEHATSFYRGDFLRDFHLRASDDFEQWVLLKREWLRHETLEALYHLANYEEQQAAFDTAYQYAWQQVELDPLREEAHRQLMRILSQQGRRSEALAQYATFRKRLAEEFDEVPEEETDLLYDKIRRGDLNRGAEESVRVSVNSYADLQDSTNVTNHNLPANLTPLIGRKGELSRLDQLLTHTDVRLLTIFGQGGIGKTCLAIEGAAAQVDHFADGVYFVPLAPLESVEALVGAVAKAIGFSFYEAKSQKLQLQDYIRHRSMLLVMDNFEHLLDGAIFLVDLLQHASNLKIMATSRARLNVQGEHIFGLEGLEVPPEIVEDISDISRYDAVQLFLRNTARVQPDFAPSRNDLAHIAHICRLVQGMPLAILLASTWIEMLTPETIATEIIKSSDILKTDFQDVPQRQRSVRAVFDHSWNLLTEPEKRLLMQTDVFRGGFTHKAAEAVTGTSLDTLKSLADKSFLNITPDGRFQVHVLLRQYAKEKIEIFPALAQTAQNKHYVYFMSFLQQQESKLRSVRQHATIVEIDGESENCRRAWYRAIEQKDIVQLDHGLVSMGLFYHWQGAFQTGATIFQDAVEKLLGDQTSISVLPDRFRVGSRLLLWQSSFAKELNQSEKARQLLRQSWLLLKHELLAREDIRMEEADVLFELGLVTSRSDRMEARQLLERCLALYRELEYGWGIAKTLRELGWITQMLGDTDTARSILEESVVEHRTVGNYRGMANALQRLGFNALDEGRYDQAEHLIRGGLAFQQEFGSPSHVADNFRELGVALLRLGKFAEVISVVENARQVYDNLGHQVGIVRADSVIGHAELNLGNYQVAQVLGNAALALSKRSGTKASEGHAYALLGCVELAKANFQTAQGLIQQSIDVFREIGPVFHLSWVLPLWGCAAAREQDMLQPCRVLTEAIQISRNIGAVLPLVSSLPAVALLLVGQEKIAQAVEVYALASRYPLIANSRWYEDIVGQAISSAVDTLPQAEIQSAKARGQARDLWKTSRELLRVLS